MIYESNLTLSDQHHYTLMINLTTKCTCLDHINISACYLWLSINCSIPAFGWIFCIKHSLSPTVIDSKLLYGSATPFLYSETLIDTITIWRKGVRQYKIRLSTIRNLYCNRIRIIASKIVCTGKNIGTR